MAGTFSESWYRVANVRAALRPSVNFRKQTYQGEEWYVLSDPYTGSFFRLSPAYYDFVAQLSFDHTVEELWVKTLEQNPQTAPGQQSVINLLSELNSSNLIFFQDAGDTSRMFERQWQKDRQKTRKQLMNFLFIRVPLGNPNRLLEKFKSLWKIIFSRIGFFVWLGVVLFGIKTAIEHASLFASESSNVLDPDNLVLLYISMAILKSIHEWGHGALCKRFDGEVNAWGVMFVLFTPLPFVDTTSVWMLRDKWQRILVSSGGMIVELFVGAIACVIWVNSPPGIIHGVAYNVMFTASVSTLLFNANPLMRFDGYYILSDLIEIPNLQQKSKDQVYYLAQKHLFGVRQVKQVSRSRKEGILLALFGVSAMIYRLFLTTGIVLFIADSYFILGMILAVVMGSMWLVAPIFKYFKFIHGSAVLRRVRLRAFGITYGALILVLVAVFLVPFDRSIEAMGVLEAEQHQELTSRTEGRLQSILAQPNQLVVQGEILLELENPQLKLELRKVEAELKQNEVMLQKVLQQRGLDREPIMRNKESLLQLKQQIEEKIQALQVRAPNDGVWIFKQADKMLGQWVAQGTSLGHVVDETTLRFSAVVAQEDASDLFDMSFSQAVIRLKENPQKNLVSKQVRLHPHAQEKLPSKALGWQGGGSVAVQQNDPDGRVTLEPFYLIYASVDQNGGFHDGQTGRMKIDLQPVALGHFVFYKIQQFLQKRYQL
ncbi:MAG: biotin/lipoyl-binding protein [Methylocystaceae bacterium]|nr:biotin/lipoyl-binding protein [Methylocystaceae bacterium]